MVGIVEHLKRKIMRIKSLKTLNSVSNLGDDRWVILGDTKSNLYKINYNILKPYRVYSALLTQAGIAAPVATVLEDSIGNIVWTRNGAGNYLATSNNAFSDINKLQIFIGGNTDSFLTNYACGWNDANSVYLSTATEVAGPGFDLSDGLLLNLSIEIKVYH